MAWNGIRNKEVTFLGTSFHKQKCPVCETVYEFMALGKDLRRNEMPCPQCADPELFIEKEPCPELQAMVEELNRDED